MADATDYPQLTEKPKKRKSLGSKRDLAKKARLSNHTTGEDCKCTLLKCFDVVNIEDRAALIQNFIALKTKDEQDAFLCSVIRTKNVQRRRPKRPEEEAQFNEFSYSYHVRVLRDGNFIQQNVCFKAFVALFGITNRRVQTVKKALTSTGCTPKDKRGQHNNRPHKLSDLETAAIREHISSFRGRKSHYALGKTRKLYLPADLNVSRMHALFRETHPGIELTYETYRRIFVKDFNIGFGYPRKDTCATCDELVLKLEHVETEIKNETDKFVRVEKMKEKDLLTTEHEIHKRKADTFYKRKSEAKKRAQGDISVEAICFDFQKNLPVPNKTCNDVYYRRQLTFVSFNIHVLSTDDVYLFTYDETKGKKGADDVASMLYFFLMNHLSSDVTDLEAFCDGCAGQNKNFTIIRFFQSMIHNFERFKSVKLTFPIRGHSYMECDRDMGLVNQKADTELPEDWCRVLEEARVKPMPYNVIRFCRDQFLGFTDYLKPNFRATCPFPTRPVREILFGADHPKLVSYRNSWNGPMETAVIRKTQTRSKRKTTAPHPALKQLYATDLLISKEKYSDLQVLKRFCQPANHAYFDSLPTATTDANEDTDNSGSDSDA